MAVSKLKTPGGVDRVLWSALAAAGACGVVVAYFDRWQSALVIAAAIYVLAHELRSQRDVRATLVALLLLFALLVYSVGLVLLQFATK